MSPVAASRVNGVIIGGATFARLCRARELLCETDGDGQVVRDIARALRLSPYHFIRQFHAVFGATPHQVRIEARLDRAKRLLALGERSVTDVCMDVGFSSVGSFSSLFARRVGTTPSAYRRSVRALVQVPGTLPATLVPGCLSLMALLPRHAFRNFREA